MAIREEDLGTGRDIHTDVPNDGIQMTERYTNRLYALFYLCLMSKSQPRSQIRGPVQSSHYIIFKASLQDPHTVKLKPPGILSSDLGTQITQKSSDDRRCHFI